MGRLCGGRTPAGCLAAAGSPGPACLCSLAFLPPPSPPHFSWDLGWLQGEQVCRQDGSGLGAVPPPQGQGGLALWPGPCSLQTAGPRALLSLSSPVCEAVGGDGQAWSLLLGARPSHWLGPVGARLPGQPPVPRLGWQSAIAAAPGLLCRLSPLHPESPPGPSGIWADWRAKCKCCGGAPLHPRGPEVVNVRSSPRMGCWFRVPPCWGGR